MSLALKVKSSCFCVYSSFFWMLALAKSNPRVDFLGDGAIKSGLGAALKTGIFLGD
jgi:hypothetical protein